MAMPEAMITERVAEEFWKWTEPLYYIIMIRMTKSGAILSVRLDPALAAALERHCAQTGATRSRVVQQSMAQYLVAHSGPTLSQLAEALLPSLPKRRSRTARPSLRAGRPSRQQRFREYVRDKRHR
jgi:hypothetical protein